MKKIISLLLVITAIAGFFTGCASSEGKALKKFNNSRMKGIYKTFEEVKEESDGWKTIGNDDELVSIITEKQIPSLEKLLKKVSEIKTDSEEIDMLKKKYIMVIELHINGYKNIASGVDHLEQEDILKGMDYIAEGEKLLDEYRSDIKKLAKKYGVKLK